MRKPLSHRHVPTVLAATVALASVIATGWAWWAGGSPDPPEPTAASSPPAPPPAPPPPVSRRGPPIRGEPLRGPTGLRLLIADAPAPFVLDVDSGEATRVTGLPADGERLVWVVRVGTDALIASDRACPTCGGEIRYFLLRDGDTVATPFERAFAAVGSHDGQGAWLLTRRRPRGCAIREVDLTGRDRRPPLLASCKTGLVADLPGGLLVDYEDVPGVETSLALVRPDGRERRYEDWQAQPLVENLVLSGLYWGPFTIHDMARGTSRTVSFPARPEYGISEVVGEPGGAHAAVEFFRRQHEDRIDVWVLDTRTRRWRHLPDMPTGATPKETTLQWTGDGRLVMLNRRSLGVWTPADARIGVRRVKPALKPGTTFLVLTP